MNQEESQGYALLNFARELKIILGPHSRHAIALFILVAACAAADTFGIGMLLPLLQAVFAPGAFGAGLDGWILNAIREIPEDRRVVLLGAMTLAVFALKTGLSILQYWFAARFANNLRQYWTDAILGGGLNGPYLAIKSLSHGVFVNSCVQEPVHAAKAIRDGIDLVVSILVIVGVLVLLLAVDSRMALSILAVILLIVAAVWKVSAKYSKDFGKKRLRLNQEISQTVVEAISGVRQVKLFSVETRVLGEITEKFKNLLRLNSNYAVIQHLPHLLGELMLVTLVILGLIAGVAILGLNVQDLLPKVAMFGAGFLRLFGAAARLVATRMSVMTYWPSLKLVTQLASEGRSTEEAGSGERVVKSQSTAIEFRNVSLVFPNGKKALDSIDLEIRPGLILGLVGRSGSGKSSLCDLLARLYAPTAGGIFCDDVDISQFDLRAWRRNLAYVSQDTWLFHASVRDNLRVGNDAASEKHMWDALAAADAEDFVRGLPHALDTLVGQGGLTLSGGQRQRLAIARALIRDADVLIFDEATSALDIASERKILNRLRSNIASKAVIMTTHRLHTMELADEILFLKEGRMVQRGAWHSLSTEQSGEFYRLLSADPHGH